MARLIDSDEFIKELSQLCAYAGWDERDIHFSLSDIACNLEMMPVFNVVLDFQAKTPKHGHWIEVDTQCIDETKCSNCGVVEYFDKGWKRFNYCPNCGAKMDEVET